MKESEDTGIKSPFLVYQGFLSPKLCDQILDQIRVEPNERQKGTDGKPINMELKKDDLNSTILNLLEPIIPEIEEHYGLVLKGFEKPLFQFYPEGTGKLAEEPQCQSSKFLRKKWVKCYDRDLTAIIWLKDYQDEPPIDTKTEVYGGKLELPAHQFSLVPQRGTLIIYPAGPHFITAISQVLVGDLYQIRLQIAHDTEKEGPWFYQPENFRGNWFEWFKEYV